MVEDMPWDAATQADVLAYWTAEGVLLPEADIQPHQLAAQRQTRENILEWGGMHKRHRSVAFLSDYLRRVRAAAAELGYGGDAAQLTLASAGYIKLNLDPFGVIRARMAAGKAPVSAPCQRRTRGLGPPVDDVPLTADTQAAALAFWTAEGVLLPEADTQPQQAARQARKRPSILRWAAKHKRHRSVPFLADYMRRMRAAAAAEPSYDGHVAELAVSSGCIIGDNRDPAGVIRRHLAAAAKAQAKDSWHRYARVTDVRWDAKAQAALLAFWTAQGAFVQAANEQSLLTELPRTRQEILEWGGKYKRHRSVAFLEHYMRGLRAAAAELGYSGDVAQFALSRLEYIQANKDPARVVSERLAATAASAAAVAAAAAAPVATATSARKPHGRKPRGPEVEDAPLTAGTLADVLAFWTAEGVLLPAADVQPHEVAQQRRVHQQIRRWAAAYKRHRSVPFLEDYMGRMRAAVAAQAYGGNAAQLAAADDDFIRHNTDPAIVVRRVRNLEETLRRLHPQLSVGKMARSGAGLLSHAGEAIAARWAALHPATGLDSEGVRAAVEACPNLLALDTGPIAWRLRQARAYDSARRAAIAAGAAAMGISSTARLGLTASRRVWRLPYLASVSAFSHSARFWADMPHEKFDALHGLGFEAWLKEHPMPPEAYFKVKE